MTPAELTALTGLINLLRDVLTVKGAGLTAVLIFGPEIALFLIVLFMLVRWERMNDLTKANAEEQRKQFESVCRMYENNAELVKNVSRIAENLQDIVLLNTQQMQAVRDLVSNNLYCPLMRKGMETPK